MQNPKQFKHIIYKRFLFRIKNNKLQVALHLNKETNLFHLPIRYELKAESFKKACEGKLIRECDRDDYELWMLGYSNVHPGKHTQWFDVLNINNTNLQLKEIKDLFIVILDEFKIIFNELIFPNINLDIKLSDNFATDTYNLYFEYYKDILKNDTKKRYIQHIEKCIANNGIELHRGFLFAYEKIQMDIDLLKKELEELKYFKAEQFNIANRQVKDSEIEYYYDFKNEWFNGKIIKSDHFCHYPSRRKRDDFAFNEYQGYTNGKLCEIREQINNSDYEDYIKNLLLDVFELYDEDGKSNLVFNEKYINEHNINIDTNINLNYICGNFSLADNITDKTFIRQVCINDNVYPFVVLINEEKSSIDELYQYMNNHRFENILTDKIENYNVDIFKPLFIVDGCSKKKRDAILTIYRLNSSLEKPNFKFNKILEEENKKQLKESLESLNYSIKYGIYNNIETIEKALKLGNSVNRWIDFFEKHKFDENKIKNFNKINN